jgi:hypothetical protein
MYILIVYLIAVMTQQSSIDYILQATSTGVCITCTFLDSFITNCLVVVHQGINSSGLMNIESSHKFTRSGDTAYGCIEGVNLEQYQVGVPGGKMIMEPNFNSNSLLSKLHTGINNYYTNLVSYYSCTGRVPSCWSHCSWYR